MGCRCKTPPRPQRCPACVRGAPGQPCPEPPAQAGTPLCSCRVLRCWISDHAGDLLAKGTQALHAVARRKSAMTQGTSRRAGWASGGFLRSRNGCVGIVHQMLQYGCAPPLFSLYVLSTQA